MAIWWRLKLMVAILLVTGASAFGATTGQLYWCDTRTGFAIAGFDPVAYFVDQMPRQGSAAHEYLWHGVTWRFVSAANMAVFERDPDVYAPQYGGYGALRVADGALLEGNPVLWQIHDDRLYFFTNVERLEAWKRAPKARKRRADSLWPKVNRVLVTQ